jgi:hypothetical protein
MDLKNFVTDLANDAEKWARFRKEPNQMIDEANLTAEDRKLLTEGPMDQLRTRLGSSGDAASVAFIW